MQPYTGTFELIDPTKIVLDHKYQRPEKWDLIAKISASPEWAAFGVILCSKRTGTGHEDLFYCLDGQQRLNGILASTTPPATVPALWFAVQSVKEEARLFSLINEQRKAVNALEKYRSHITQEDPRYMQITAAAERAGFTIGSKTGGARTIGAFEGLQVLYNAAGEDGVYIVLSAIRKEWEDDNQAVSTWMLRALADVLTDAKSNGGLNPTKLAAGLAKTTPGRILRKAEELRFEQGGSKRVNVRKAFKALARI